MNIAVAERVVRSMVLVIVFSCVGQSIAAGQTVAELTLTPGLPPGPFDKSFDNKWYAGGRLWNAGGYQWCAV